MPREIRFLIVLTAPLLSSLAGCAAINPFDRAPNEIVKADAEHPVAQVLCLWQPAEGRGLDDLPSRGFAGQIIFLTAQARTPVEVEGDVTIYLFDDQSPPDQQSQPIHVFRFVDGSWQAHLQQTAWGPTYQLFVPYVRKGNRAADCVLCVRLDPHEGPRVKSDLAKIDLPGIQAPPLVGRIDGPPPASPPSNATPAFRSAGQSTGAAPASALLPTRPGVHPADFASPQAKFQSFSIPYTIQPGLTE